LWSESVRTIFGAVPVIVILSAKLKSPVAVISPVTSRPFPTSKFPFIPTSFPKVALPFEAMVSLSALFVWSVKEKTPLLFFIEKSESLFVSVKNIFGFTFDIVIFPTAALPEVFIFCVPKLGLIFVPSIAALAFISVFVIEPLMM